MTPLVFTGPMKASPLKKLAKQRIVGELKSLITFALNSQKEI
jgi:hypothetical protein